MSSVTTLARPYAKAAFALAQDEGELARWEEMLGVTAAIVEHEAMADLLDSPHVSDTEAVRMIADTARGATDEDLLNERFRGFLSVLADNGRLALLPAITGLYRELRAEAEKRLRVRVVSAIALDDAQSSHLQEALAQRFDREIELENEIDPKVIGGAVIYAGDEVIDGSLRGRLQKLSSSLAR
jgi:F-type H+-transporting ATPase subunit delta